MRVGRRDFLLRAAAASGAAAAAALPGCAPDVDPAPLVDVPAPVDGRIPLLLAAYPDLARPGGAITVRAPSLSPILVVHAPDGSFAATGAVCTHQGCPLGVDAGGIVCPCHLSRFALDGAVEAPPARAGLPVYGVARDEAAGVVAIDLRAGDPGFPAAVDGRVFLPFDAFPALRPPASGGAVAGRPGGYGRPILVAAVAPGAYAAVDAVCPHLQCTVGWAPAQGEIACPCHGSRFAPDGTLLAGPATRGLLALEASADAAGVTVRLP